MTKRLRISYVSGFAAALLLAFVPGALAAQPAALTLDSPDNGTAPLVAYAPSDGYAYVAWSAPINQNAGNGIDLCILPPGGTACEGGGAVLLEDTNTGALGGGVIGLAGLVVLPSSGEVVVLGSSNGLSTGTFAWSSPPGGADFLAGANGSAALQNGGVSISPVSLYYTPNNTVGLSGADVGLFDSYDHSYSYFSDSPFAGPKTPASLPSGTGNANNGGSFDDQHEIGSTGSQLAAEPAPAPAAAGSELVVGVGANVRSSQPTPTGCINYAATGYGVAVGTTGSSGTLNAEGLQQSGFGLLACSAEDPVVASGGTDGIGEFAQEGSGVSGAGSTYTLDYRPFIATATGGSFGSPVQLQDDTSASLGGAINLDLADDSGTGVYASWEDKAGLVLDYSPNGGATWDPPVIAPALANGANPGDPTIVGVGSGIVDVAYDANPGTGEQVFLQTVDLVQPTPVTVTTSQTSGTTTGANISIPAGTIDETDQATLSGTHAATATGTVDYALYTKSDCSAASQVASGSGAVTAGKPAASAPITTALSPGTYYWKAAYTGDAANDAGTSACGSEKLTVEPAATGPGTGTTTGTTVTLTITCSGPCTVTVTITYTTGGAADAAGAARARTVTLAKGKFTLKHRGKKKLTLKLTKRGRSLVKKYVIKKHHGKLKTRLRMSDKTAHGTFKSTRTLKIIKKK